MKFAFLRYFENKSVMLLTNIAVAAGLLWSASLWVGLIVSSKMTPDAAPRASGPVAGQQTVAHADYSIITQRSLFNPGVKASPASGEIIPCTLPFRLMGTIITSEKSEGVAIIENSTSREQNLYHVNDSISQGAVIAQIGRLEVILNNNGRRERLSMEFGEAALTQPGKGPGFGALPAGAQVAKVGESQVMMDKRYFDSQKGNMNDLMTQVRAMPHMAPDGSINGFQLFEIVKDSVYDKIGLKNQDILKRVNGQELNSVEGGLDLFNALKNDNHFTLDVIRNSQNKSITVDIQ